MPTPLIVSMCKCSSLTDQSVKVWGFDFDITDRIVGLVIGKDKNKIRFLSPIGQSLRDADDAQCQEGQDATCQKKEMARQI